MFYNDRDNFGYRLARDILRQTYWEGHVPSDQVCDFPDVFHVIYKIKDIKADIINPVIEGFDKVRASKSFPLDLNIVELDASFGVESLVEQVLKTPPDTSKINLYFVRPYEAIANMGKKEVEFFQNFVKSLMGNSFNGFIIMEDVFKNNTHVVILSENKPEPENDLWNLHRKGILREIFLHD